MRITGINIPDSKRLEVALTVIYGVGKSRARMILNNAKISYNTLAKDLKPEEEKNIRELVDQYKTEGVLRREVSGNIKRLIDVKSYRGSRHSKHLPVRGQRTKTNSRTRRGNIRKTMTSGRKKVEKK